MLYPKGQLLDALTTDPALAEQVFAVLQDITPLSYCPKGTCMAGGCMR
jgi:hypothetical protein